MKLEIYINLELCTKEEGKIYDRIFALEWKKEAHKINEVLRKAKDRGVFHTNEEYAMMSAGNRDGYHCRPTKLY